MYSFTIPPLPLTDGDTEPSGVASGAMSGSGTTQPGAEVQLCDIPAELCPPDSTKIEVQWEAGAKRQASSDLEGDGASAPKRMRVDHLSCAR